MRTVGRFKRAYLRGNPRDQRVTRVSLVSSAGGENARTQKVSAGRIYRAGNGGSANIRATRALLIETNRVISEWC